jgi:ABC-type nitrate/sulfonate/bicarbonate transport system substrate-binding protein
MTARERGVGVPNGLSRRRFITVAGSGVAGGLLMVACGGDGDGATTTAGGTGTTGAAGAVPSTSISSITVGYNNPNRVLRAPLYVGQTKGFFADVGIESVEINDADDPIPPTLAGSYHVALYDSDVLYDFEDKAVQGGDPQGLKMISINLGSQPLVFVANEGITVDNLAGKIVGGGREGMVNEALAKFMLQEMGYNWETDVDFRNLTGGSDDWVTTMLSGAVDATIGFPRHIPLAEEVGGSALYQDFLNSPQGGFGMLQSKIDEDPNFPVAWNYAYLQAQRYVKTLANKEEVRSILNDEFQIDFPDNAWEVFDLDATILSQDLGFDPAEMDEWLGCVAPFGNVREDIPWRDYTDVSYLHQAQEALDLDPNPAADLSSGQELIDNF